MAAQSFSPAAPRTPPRRMQPPVERPSLPGSAATTYRSAQGPRTFRAPPRLSSITFSTRSFSSALASRNRPGMSQSSMSAVATEMTVQMPAGGSTAVNTFMSPPCHSSMTHVDLWVFQTGETPS